MLICLLLKILTCVCANVTNVHSMTQMRELENSHHEAVTNSGLILLEMFAKNKIDDILDDLRPVRVH